MFAFSQLANILGETISTADLGLDAGPRGRATLLDNFTNSRQGSQHLKGGKSVAEALVRSDGPKRQDLAPFGQ